MIRRSDFEQIARGVLMGGADVVPGVSGGTVALILGIYGRLVRAISCVDGAVLRHLRRGEWRAAAEHVDFRFLLFLGIGIVGGIIGLASLMHYLLEDQEHVTLHSINRDDGRVLLNVGAQAGGVPVGTVCPVYRREGDGRRFRQIGGLRIESYRDQPEEERSVRTAVAKPVGTFTVAGMQPDDVVAQPSTRRPFALAAFFGLILASTVLVGRMNDRWTLGAVLLAIAGAAFSFWLVGRFPVKPWEGDGYLFLCGVLAICAMILPGISGAFILLILGVYSDVTGLLRTTLRGEATEATAVSIAVFMAGCVIGLLSFSKLLNWLLGRYRILTMAVLCGFMAGSLRKIWPFKHDLTPDEHRYKAKLFDNIWPESFD
ncbi:MAG: DUF368 domain-containing protein, partial [Planctomycetaceae bacterium]